MGGKWNQVKLLIRFPGNVDRSCLGQQVALSLHSEKPTSLIQFLTFHKILHTSRVIFVISYFCPSTTLTMRIKGREIKRANISLSTVVLTKNVSWMHVKCILYSKYLWNILQFRDKRMLSSVIADFNRSLPHTISRKTIDEDSTEWHKRTPAGLVRS